MLPHTFMLVQVLMAQPILLEEAHTICTGDRRVAVMSTRQLAPKQKLPTGTAREHDTQEQRDLGISHSKLEMKISPA